MVSKERTTIRGRRVRATRVDNCGAPIYGDKSQAVSKAFASVAYTANTIDNEGIDQRDADGEPGIYVPGTSKFASYAVEAVFNRVDPEFFSLITKQRVYRNDSGDAIGFVVNSDVDTELEGFALELWAGTPDGACEPGSTQEFGYFLLPFLKGARLGDHTIENGAVNFTITGATTRNGTGWGSGPYPVEKVAGVAAPLFNPLLENDHKLLIWTDVPPPELFTGWRPLMDPTKTPITAVTVAKGATAMTAAFTFTGGAAGVPVYIEYGDGTYQYIPAGTSGATHLYPGAGVYTARATSNGVVRTVQVTVPFP